MEQNTKNKTCGKIIKMPYRGVITDDDICSLFDGLIKLIKQNALSVSEKKYEEYITKLKKEIAMLRLENKILQGETK